MLLPLLMNLGMFGGQAAPAPAAEEVARGGGRARRKRYPYESLRGKVTPDEFRLAREILSRIDREDRELEAREVIREVVEKEVMKEVRRSRKAIFPQVEPVIEKMEAIVLPFMETPGFIDFVDTLDRRKREEEWLILFVATLH